MTTPPDPALVDQVGAVLAGTWPVGTAAGTTGAARAAIDALRPHDFIETMLAARMIAAHHATMDCYRRAMRPSASDAETIRLRNNAIAAGRSFDTALWTFKQALRPADNPGPAQRGGRTRSARNQAPPTPDPLADFTPEEIAAAEYALDHDPVRLKQEELAQRIPLHRWQDMTPEERRIAYAASPPLTPAQVAVLGARMIAAHNPAPAPVAE